MLELNFFEGAEMELKGVTVLHARSEWAKYRYKSKQRISGEIPGGWAERCTAEPHDGGSLP